MTNMTTKEIKEASTMELAIRMNTLFSTTEGNIEDILLADIKEIAAIDDELKRRLYKALGREAERSLVDFIPDSTVKPEAEKAKNIKFP